MKKQKLSIRLLSLLLTLCLLIGILPAGMAVQADPDAYHFFFMRLRTGSYSTAALQPQDVTEWGWENEVANYMDYETDPFIYYGEGGDLTDFSWQSSSANLPEFGPYLIGKPGAWGGYVVRIDSSGYFTPTITYAGVTNGGKFDAYIAPLGVENPLDEEYYIGTFNTKTAALSYQKKATMNKVALAAGDYVFAYAVADGQDEPTSWVSALNLDPTSGKWIDLRADAAEVVMFESTSTTVSLQISGSNFSASDLDSLEIAVNDTSVADATLTVDGDTAIIDIEGKYLGTTAINVTAKEGDAIGHINIPVSVSWPDDYKQTDTALVGMPESVELGYTKTASATLKYNGLPFVFEDADSVEFISDDPTIVKTSYDFDEDGNIVLSMTANQVGETTVTLNVTVDGEPATASATVGVHARVFNFNFMKLYYGPWSDSAFKPNTIDNFEKMATGSKGDINPNGAYSDPWMYSKTTGDAVVDWTPSSITYGMDIHGSKGSSVQFKIRLDQSGVYRAQVNTTLAATGQNAEIFVAPLDAPNPTAPWYSVGVMDTWANAYDYFVDLDLGETVLAAGDYYLTFVMTDPNPKSSATWMPTAAFKLKTLQILNVTLEHDADEATVMENGSETINLTAKYDGEAYDFSNIASLTVTSDHPEIATGSVDLENATMTINGHSLGNAVLNVTGETVDGDAIIFNVPYEVVPAEFFRRVTSSVEPAAIEVGETAQIDWHAYRIDKQEIDKSILQVYHESSDTSVAMVDDNGVVTARNGGTATITTYVLHEDGSTRTASVDVTVGGYQALGKVELVVPGIVQAGGNVTLATKARFEDNTSADLEALGATITYEVLEGSARISKNLMRVSARGTVVLRSVVEFNGATYYSDPVTVQAIKNGDPAAFSKLILSVDRTTISVGETAQLKAGGQLLDGSYLYWTELFTHASNKHNTITLVNSAEDVISIDDNGVVTALKTGVATLTLTADVEGVPHEKELVIIVDDDVLESAEITLAKKDILIGDSVDINVLAKLSNGRVAKESDLALAFSTSDDTVAVVENGVLVTKGVGTATLTVAATMNNVTVEGTLKVTVLDDTLDTLTASASALTIKPSSEGTQISVTAKTKSGAAIDPANLTLSYKSKDESVATVSETGFVTPASKGTAVIEVTAQLGDVTKTATVSIKIKDGKEAPTYITYEKREAAKENIANFDWAKKTRDNYMNSYAYYLDDADWAWNLITSQDIPRACDVGTRWHPDKYNCAYCGTNVTSATGDFYPWKYDVKNYPWKIQCPNCMRRFPSNDFDAFYKAGINEHGFFDYEYAKANASHLLVNMDYPEMDEHVDKNGVLQNEGVHGWGVDDSRGYVTDEKFDLLLGYGEAYRSYNFIAYYNHWALWYGPGIDYSIQYMGTAYALTGDMRYGRIGAIMMDRIADMYPDMYASEYFPEFSNSDFNTARGRLIGGIWDTGLSAALCKTYDMLYPAFDDPWVVNFLSGKAKQYNLGDPRGEQGTEYELRGGVGNDKSTPELIRQNIENGLLREVLDAVLVENQIYGNQGMHQGTVAAAAVVLDSMPETSDALDWVLGGGGMVLSDIIGTLNRDGQGAEAAPGYSDTWVSSYSGIVDVLESYDGYAAANLYDNVKYVKLMKTNFPMTLTRNGTAPIGDSGSVAATGMQMSMGRLVTAFMRTGDPEIAQMIYFLNGNKATGIEADIYTPATTVADDIQAVIDTYGEYPFDESSAMTGSFGFYALRDGVYKKGLSKPVNTQRDFWMFFGRSLNHGHPGLMNLGIDAYGMAISSDFGYPESTSGTPRTLHWDRSTIIHNTVQVNDKPQTAISGGQALHFEGDNDGRVQVMDAKAPNVYPETEEYRRTTVMVDYDEEISYAVDFFRIIGGDSHTFVQHVIGSETPETELKMVKQTMGTYAGALVPYGPMDNPNYAETSGYDGFYDVSRAASPGNEFTVDFKVDDIRDRLTENRDVHLRMTQLNDFDITEVALAKANPPKNNDNPDYVNSILIDRHGKNLDSLFTTVFQPYDKTPYIEKEEQVSITRSGGGAQGAKDAAKAVKVTMKNGRVDYIIYASNNNVQYQVDGWLQFKGFVGVVSVEDGEIVYSYVCDGSLIGETTATPSYTGTVVDFTKVLSFDNEIIVKPNQEMDLDEIIGRYIFVNGKAHSYKIQNATKRSDGTVVLDIGDFCMLSSVKNSSDPINGGYNYEIANGQSFEIILSKAEDDSPIFTAIPDQVVTVGDTLTVPFNATTMSGAEATFELVAAPNNTYLDAETQTVSFGPVTSQIGSHTIGIKASNGSLSNVIYFEVEVFAGSATGAAGGGGGGGSDEPEEVTYDALGGNVYVDSDGNVLSAGPDKTPGTADDIADVKKNDDGVYYYVNEDGKVVTAGADGFLGTADDAVEEDAVVPTEKFVDLGNHAWAKDAIYRLVDAGVIKGVDDTHYAPANQITRADFAILLVRAWDLSADELGAFEDVAASDYFAREVGIASALGIVNGVGEGKFAPKDPITREQMMVMLARTLKVVEAEVAEVEDDVLADFSDADLISDYAVDAVKSMVGNGYIQGANGKINPQGNATRAEVAVLLDRILNK